MEQMELGGYEDPFFGKFHGLLLCVKCGLGIEEIHYQEHMKTCPLGIYEEVSEQNNVQIPPKAPNYENCNEFLPTTKENTPAVSEVISPTLLQQDVPKVRTIGSIPSEFSCNICQTKFSKLDGLKRHVTFKHENPSSFKCEFCNKTFTYKDAHKRHVTYIHLNPFQFTCDICDKKFSYLENLTRHVTLIHENPSSYKCNLCGKTFNVKSVLNNHILRMHMTVRRYKCEDCNYVSMDKQYYLTHVKKCALKRNKSIQDTDFQLLESKSEDDILCSVCGLPFQDINSLLDHIKGHVNGTKEHVPIVTEQIPVKRVKIIKNKLPSNIDNNVKTVKTLKPKKCQGKTLDKKQRSKLPERNAVTGEINEKQPTLTYANNINKNPCSVTVHSRTSFINGNFQRSLHDSDNKPCDKSLGVDNYTHTQNESIYSSENADISENPLDMRAALAKALNILYQNILVEEDLEKYRCKLCSITCLSATALESHMKRHLP